MKTLVIFIVILFPFLLTGEMERIAFKDLCNTSLYLNKTVQIRGFLYEKEGKKILSSEPNLKTCCVGTDLKRQSQIIVEGDVSPGCLAVTLEGVLMLEEDTYILKNARHP